VRLTARWPFETQRDPGLVTTPRACSGSFTAVVGGDAAVMEQYESDD